MIVNSFNINSSSLKYKHSEKGCFSVANSGTFTVTTH